MPARRRVRRVGGPGVRSALAGRAHQASDGVVPPASAHRAGPDVGLADRYRVFIPSGAASYFTLREGPSYLITQHGLLGDGDRIGERISAQPPGLRCGYRRAMIPGSRRPGAEPCGAG